MYRRLTLLALGVALSLAISASADSVVVSQPALTAQTLNSGGVMPPEQARLHFDHAELHWSINPAQQRLDGNATLTFTAKSATDTVLLDLDRNLPISRIAVDGKALSSDAWSNPDGRLRIRLPARLAAGHRVEVNVRYSGKPHVAKNAPWDGGFVWSHTSDGQPWIASAVEGEGCDLFWPCIDQPQGEPDVVDTFMTVPKALSAPGNGVLIGITDEGDQRTWHWRIKDPDTYAISINVGPFKELKANYASRYGNTIPMQFWYVPGHEKQAQALFSHFPRMLDFFEQEIGPYPFGDEKMGVVETPYLGMEHQTINAYGNGYRENGYGFDSLLQHEFAHEWFGNQVTNANWDDMWLHEAFATYMQPLYSQYLNGDMDYFSWLHQLRLKLIDRRPVVSGSSKNQEQVYQQKTGPGQDIYNKGALMLHSLRQLIGDQDFFKSIRLLVYGRNDPKPGNFSPRYATTADYVAMVNKVTGRDLGWFFDVYLYDAALPRLDVKHDGDSLTLRWVTEHGTPFPMPVQVQVGDVVHVLPMTRGAGRLHVPAGSLLIIDPHSRLLREMPHIKAYQKWKAKQDAKRPAEPGRS
jgi:aminopeptidase N